MNHIKLSWQDVEKSCQNIIRKIHIDGFRPDLIVGITRGGLVPATMISHYIRAPLYTQKICLRDNPDCEGNGWLPEEAFGVFQQEIGFEGKSILIVDDINDTGATFDWLKNDWQNACHPYNESRWSEIWGKTVRFAVLIDNIASPFEVNYSSKEINKAEKDVWIDFPWECWWDQSS